MGDRLWADRPSRYVTSYLGQLSLPSLWGRQIEPQPVWLGLRRGVFTLGMYRISLFQIRPEPDLAGFLNSNPAGAGTGAGFENVVQQKQHLT